MTRLNVDEARRHVGELVTYHGGARPEYGTITSVGPGWNGYVFVRFHGDPAGKACRPEDLSLEQGR